MYRYRAVADRDNGHVLSEGVAEGLIAAKQLAVGSAAGKEEEIVVDAEGDAPDVLHHDTNTCAVRTSWLPLIVVGPIDR